MLMTFHSETSRAARGGNDMQPGSHMRDGASRNPEFQLPFPHTLDDMVEISLTRGRVTIIDKSDFDMVSRQAWHWRPGTTSVGTGYAVRSSRDENGKPYTIFLHRLLLGVGKGIDVDHINRNSLDNRRCNLRAATRSQNIANSTYPTRPNSTGYRGVSFRNDGGPNPYSARIYVHGRNYYGVSRHTAIEAAHDYDLLAIRHFGEFATLNFPRHP